MLITSRCDPRFLILGTVRFGMGYGLVGDGNKKLDDSEAKEILDTAYSAGIRILDTAASYGDSEATLGRCGMDRWSVITKIPSMSQVDESQIAVQVRHAVRRSLDRLKVNRVHAVLVHDPQDLVGERGSRLFDQLRALRQH